MDLKFDSVLLGATIGLALSGYTKAVALVAVDKLYVNVHVCSVLHNLSVHRVIDGKLISAK